MGLLYQSSFFLLRFTMSRTAFSWRKKRKITRHWFCAAVLVMLLLVVIIAVLRNFWFISATTLHPKKQKGGLPTQIPYKKFSKVDVWVEPKPARLCKFVKTLSEQIAEKEVAWGLEPWYPGQPVEVMLMDPLPPRDAGIHKLIRLPGDNEECMTDSKNCSIWIEECSIPCHWRGYDDQTVDQSQVLLYHPDQGGHRQPVIPAPGQANAAIGHEPTFDFYKMWRNETWTAQLDFVVHWGKGADIPVHFFYFDSIEFGSDPGEWWKLADVEKMWEHIETKWKAGSRVPVSQRLSSAVIGHACKTEFRYKLLLEFAKNLPVASYGSCLHNATGDHQETNSSFKAYMSTLMHQKIDLIRRHPFHLAFESINNEHGFVTEKIFQSLLAGTVPIYWGPEEVKQMVPPHSFIYVDDFDTVEDLIAYVVHLSKSKEDYMKYHEWRHSNATPFYFRWTKRENRMNAPCRVCEYYASHWQDFQSHHSRTRRLIWGKDGWTREESPCFKQPTIKFPKHREPTGKYRRVTKDSAKFETTTTTTTTTTAKKLHW